MHPIQFHPTAAVYWGKGGGKDSISLIKNSSWILILSQICFNFLKTISEEQAGRVMTIICNYVS